MQGLAPLAARPIFYSVEIYSANERGAFALLKENASVFWQGVAVKNGSCEPMNPSQFFIRTNKKHPLRDAVIC